MDRGINYWFVAFCLVVCAKSIATEYSQGPAMQKEEAVEAARSRMRSGQLRRRLWMLQPVLAFGNSSGDLAMEIYTISDNPYKSAAFMVLADDEEREYGDAAAAKEKRASYEKQGIGVISMKDDFKTIYGEGVVKAEP